MSSVPTRSRFQIVFCITELDFGGAERQCVELAAGLDRERFDVRVDCLGPPPSGAGERLVARLVEAGVPVRFCGGSGWRDSWRVARQLRDRWRAERPDLVQTFLWHANVMGAIAARRAGIPRLVTGIRVAEPARGWRRPLERWAGRWADRHVAVSESVGRFARERIGLAPEKIVIVPNGIETSDFPAVPLPAALAVSQPRHSLLFVGRFDAHDQKGASPLVEHAPELLAALTSHDLLLAGDGPMRESLGRRIAACGLSERIHLLGWRDDLSAILAAAELLLVPSRWEGMSNVVLEAMAGGRAIVAMRTDGIDEQLGHAPEQIVEQGDWNAFIARVVQFAGDDALRARLGAANRAQAIARFDRRAMIAAYERLYLELLETRDAN